MWKKFVKISVMFGLFFLVFGLGAFLPDRLFAIADEKRGKSIELDNTIPLVLPDAKQAAIEKKLHLLYKEDDSSSLHFFHLDFDTQEFDHIQKITDREIRNLRKYKLIPKKADLEDLLLEKYSILDTSGTGDFLIMWFIWKKISPYGTLQFWIEAESGKIMAIDYTGGKKRNWKPARKAFRKYLCQELSLDTKDIPEFIFFYNAYSYTITSACFLAYQDMQGWTDNVSGAKAHVTDANEVTLY